MLGCEADSGGAPVAPTDSKIFGRIAILTLVVAAVGLSACGRKGPLEAPPNAVTATAPQAEEAAPPKPDRDFILDPLLD